MPREEWEGGERMKKVLLRPPILLRRRLGKMQPWRAVGRRHVKRKIGTVGGGRIKEAENQRRFSTLEEKEHGRTDR